MSTRLTVNLTILLSLWLGLMTKPVSGLETIRVASGLNRPVFAHAPANDLRLFILEQGGVIRLLKDGLLLPTPFLDIDALVSAAGSEQGLLGLAFHPDYASNRSFFVNYTDNAGNTVIARYQASANPDVADPQSAEIILTISQPFANHNGGMIAFGPDGYLYIGMGDGGSGGDPGNRAQDLGELLGKILRIDVGPTGAYTIPPDNPFVGISGAREEIWNYGLRNPWRWSFDAETGDLYIADVGQSSWEEVDFEPAATGGRNYGWRIMEGAHCYNPPTNCDDTGLVYPIHEYGHSASRCSITGGYVYRAPWIDGLQGTYFFADYCTGEIWSFRYAGGNITEFQDRTAELAPDNTSIDSPASFGEDGLGNLYIVDRGGMTTGEIFRIVEDASLVSDTRPLPVTLALGFPSPNPFMTRMVMDLQTAHPDDVNVRVLDSAGRLLRRFTVRPRSDGQARIAWDGCGAGGERLDSGAYLILVRAGDAIASRRVFVVR